MSCSTAASATTLEPASSASRATASPVSQTSRKIRESAPACGTIAECQISAPERDWRHWKNSAPSAPWARCCTECRRISPGSLGRVAFSPYTVEVPCSISSQGFPPPKERARSPPKAVSAAASTPGAIG